MSDSLSWMVVVAEWRRTGSSEGGIWIGCGSWRFTKMNSKCIRESQPCQTMVGEINQVAGEEEEEGMEDG